MRLTEPDARGRRDIARDDGLETAVIISLWTDARAPEGTPLPSPTDRDRRGWWAAPWGSLLWLFEREKETADVAANARDYAQASLQWLVDDRIAARVEVDARIPQCGLLFFDIAIAQPGITETISWRYWWNWSNQAIRPEGRGLPDPQGNYRRFLDTQDEPLWVRRSRSLADAVRFADSIELRAETLQVPSTPVDTVRFVDSIDLHAGARLPLGDQVSFGSLLFAHADYFAQDYAESGYAGWTS